MPKPFEGLEVVYRAPSELTPHAGNARTHSRRQERKIEASIEEFGFVSPILVTGDGTVIAGHGRLAAAKSLGLERIPTICLDHLTPEQIRLYLIADNRLAELAGWDEELLASELLDLSQLEGFGADLTLTGFEIPEIDLMIEHSEPPEPDEADEVAPPDLGRPSTTCVGDLWLLGDSRVLCSDARDPAQYRKLLGQDRARMIFTDPPYNVPIDGNVCGLGRHQHREFAMAVGEMTPEQFTDFLVEVFGNLARFSIDGSLHYICMDWRHTWELTSAGRDVYSELKNVCVWNKDNGGMGSFYRSKHEFIYLYKKGKAPHTNNVALGRYGRHRTNVWDYPGVNSLRKGQRDALQMHPTVKPVALVADAIRDASNRGDIVLDCFGGSGTTLIAAEKTGRRGYLIELDPRYVDVTIERYEKLSGEEARHAVTGLTYSQSRNERSQDEVVADSSEALSNGGK